MLCKKPFMKGGLIPFPCGQCSPCRVNRRRIWSHRIVLEAAKHAESWVANLTYDPEHLPEGGCLKKEDVQLFLKRLREAVFPVRFRYFCVGEYGEQFGRPHYHCILFGLPWSTEMHQTVLRAWGNGSMVPGLMSWQTAEYVGGYVNKKLTKKDDPRLCGKPPEFSLMSLKPGIGAAAMTDVAQTLLTEQGSKLIAQTGDVPTTLGHGRKQFPLGRYLRRRLRDECGFDQIGGQEKPALEKEKEMLAMREAYGKLAFIAAKPFVEWDKIETLERRQRIFRKKGSL